MRRWKHAGRGEKSTQTKLELGMSRELGGTGVNWETLQEDKFRGIYLHNALHFKVSNKRKWLLSCTAVYNLKQECEKSRLWIIFHRSLKKNDEEGISVGRKIRAIQNSHMLHRNCRRKIEFYRAVTYFQFFSLIIPLCRFVWHPNGSVFRPALPAQRHLHLPRELVPMRLSTALDR